MHLADVSQRQRKSAQTASSVGSNPTVRIRKVYGPYLYSDGSGRRFVIRHFEDGRKQTVQHAKHVWELANGPVPEGLHVHHVNEDRTDDRLENLEVIDPVEHRARHRKGRTLYTGVCSVCGEQFTKFASNVRSNQKRSEHGPFCSRSCAGRYSAARQYGNELPRAA